MDTVFGGPHNGCTYERPHVHPNDSPEKAWYLAPTELEGLRERIEDLADEHDGCFRDECSLDSAALRAALKKGA